MEAKKRPRPSAPPALSAEVLAARKWIREADRVLVVAGAGMSAYDSKTQPGMNVYVSREDFKQHYPDLPGCGFNTAYECMGLFGDPRVPREAVFGYLFNHIKNMRYTFPPNPGYVLLRDLIGDRDYFVVTSNVDGCFERAGFEAKRIYTPQGDWSYIQCRKPCSKQVWKAPEFLSKISNEQLPRKGIFKNEKDIPRCPNCGGYVMGNVRGGDWFIHDHFLDSQKALINWVNELKASKKEEKLVVIEVGAGFNTPVVTRFPAESIVRDLGERASLVRINPAENEVPVDLKAVGIPAGWQIFQALQICTDGHSEEEKKSEEHVLDRSRKILQRLNSANKPQMWQMIQGRWGHFDWMTFFKQLR